MKKNILFILLFHILIFSGYAQDSISQPVQAKIIIDVAPAAIVEPGEPGEPGDPGGEDPSGYQWNRDADGDGYGNPAMSVFTSTKPSGYVDNALDLNDGDRYITDIPPHIVYRDVDGDGFGIPGVYAEASSSRPGYADNYSDCNDNDKTINPNTAWYRDADGDGFGAAASLIKSCTQPTGFVRNGQDYNDTTANITNIAPQTFYRDADADTFGNPLITVSYSSKPVGYVTNNIDCNDADATVNPNVVWCQDGDNDGYGNPAITVKSCTKPVAYIKLDSSSESDCNDTNAAINPATFWYLDGDNDGFGKTSSKIRSCTKPQGYALASGDYDDTTANITNIAPSTFYRDADIDTYGSPTVTVYYSVKPAGYVTNNTDCNDADATINPNTKWYPDNDLDGMGDPTSFVQQCNSPSANYSRNNSDACPLDFGSGADCANLKVPALDQNYIITTNYKTESATSFVDPTADKAKVDITYFDGLGRPIQQINNQQANTGKDIITHITYDNFGRQVEEYLPFVSGASNLYYEANAAQKTVSFYTTPAYENTTNPFSQKSLESSPLNRVLKQAAPGTSWAMGGGHEIKLDYQTNTADEVRLFKATAAWSASSGLYDIAFSDAGKYAANELYKTITYDENTAAIPSESAGSTVEFKDKEGRVILKRTYESGVKHDTYYVYDQYGYLTYVIPPKANATIDASALNGLCYQYKYDSRNRLAEKKLPGKQWEFIVYDKLDRPVATGPAFSPFKNDNAVGWLITKYDAFGRPIYTGWNNTACSAAARNTLQVAQNSATVLFEAKQTSGTIDGVAVNYTNTIAPTTFKLLSVNYYDNYVFPGAASVPTTVEGQTVLANTKTLATGSWTRVPTIATAMLAEINTTFYDSKARPVRTYSTNHLGGYTYTDSKLDFTGKTLYTISRHKRTTGSTELAIREDFTYSTQDRLITHTHQINGGAAQLMADNTYDALGQLMIKKTGNTAGSPFQKVDYNYNVRGWLTEINKTVSLQQSTDPVDLFAFKINYNTVQAGITDVAPLFNGNIAETYWKTASDNIERAYGYQYDKLNRLKSAIYEKNALTTNAYNESLTYDKNGNIMSLARKGDTDPQVQPIQIDDLLYTYPASSNQLSKVDDISNNTSGFNDFNKTGDDYTYDANGNMITDKNKNITAIEYNHLNLPEKITFGTTGTIEYIYNATGQKLEKIVTQGTIVNTTNYLGGFQYKDNVLEFFPTAEGYVKNTAGVYSYVFQYKDHLGNIRVSYAKNPTTNVLEIIDENNYYPFGLKHKGYNSLTGNNNKYKYQGQERQDELGLNWDSFKWRNYDHAIGRFMSIDPLAEKYAYNSTYAFQENKMGMGVELEGLELYIDRNVILRTTDIQSRKPQNSRPGVALLEVGLGGDVSKKGSVGNDENGAKGSLTAIKGNISYSVCIDGDVVEYGFQAGQANGEVNALGQQVISGEGTIMDANGSYNLKTGKDQFTINSFTGKVDSSAAEKNQGESDLIVGLSGVGAYVKANLTEYGNDVKDFSNLVMSYIQAQAENYFNQNNTSKVEINPVK